MIILRGKYISLFFVLILLLCSCNQTENSNQETSKQKDIQPKSQIGIVNDDSLLKYRKDYLKYSKKYIDNIAQKKKLLAIIQTNGLMWITSDKNKIDITDELLDSLKLNEKSLPPIIKKKYNDESLLAIKNAIKSLRRIKSATEVGINYLLYSEKIADTKGEVEEYMILIPNGDLKDELRLTMDSYSDALKAWSISINNNVNIHSIVVPPFWEAAQKHLEKAENIFNRVK